MKLCVFCKHFNWDRIESRMGGYCETCEHPTLEGGASCKRGHFTRVADMGDMHSFLLQAETCKDYERPLTAPPHPDNKQESAHE